MPGRGIRSEWYLVHSQLRITVTHPSITNPIYHPSMVETELSKSWLCAKHSTPVSCCYCTAAEVLHSYERLSLCLEKDLRLPFFFFLLPESCCWVRLPTLTAVQALRWTHWGRVFLKVQMDATKGHLGYPWGRVFPSEQWTCSPAGQVEVEWDISELLPLGFLFLRMKVTRNLHFQLPFSRY